MKKITPNFYTLFALMALVSALLSGCGGGGSKSSASARATGRAAFTIKWPERPSRLIPVASNSIRITIMNGAAQVATQLVARPQTFASFDALPVASLTAVADAFPNVDGTGTAQAHGTVPLTITANNQTAAALTMGTTITRFQGPGVISIVGRGGSAQLTATAYDANGDVVLLAPGTITWSSDNTAIAIVDANGKVTGISTGSVPIIAQEPESGRSAILPVEVQPRLLVTMGSGVFEDEGEITIGSLIQSDGVGGSNLVRSDRRSQVFVSVAADSQGRIYGGSLSGLTRMDDVSGTNAVFYGSLGEVDAIAFDAQGRIYLADYTNDRIVRINDMQGGGRVELHNAGVLGVLNHPRGVAVDSLGRIYIADTFNERLVRVDDMTGAGAISVGNVFLAQPVSVAVDKSNRIFIADPVLEQVIRIDDMSGLGALSYTAQSPRGVALDDQGRIYFVEYDGGFGNVVRINDMSGVGQVSNRFILSGSIESIIWGISVR